MPTRVARKKTISEDEIAKITLFFILDLTVPKSFFYFPENIYKYGLVISLTKFSLT